MLLSGLETNKMLLLYLESGILLLNSLVWNHHSLEIRGLMGVEELELCFLLAFWDALPAWSLSRLEANEPCAGQAICCLY